MKARRAEKMPEKTLHQFAHFLVNIDHKTFKERVSFFRSQNKTKN
jgi:acyl-CoA thioester hydrolase